jgi:mycothiol synthase
MENLPQLIMRHPDITVLPPLALAEGMLCRTHRPGDEAAWEDIIENAFRREFPFQLLIDLGGYRPEYVLYLEKEGQCIATATAVENPAYPGEGWFRMVGVHPKAQGLGAGKIICLAALHNLKNRGYKTAVLSTDDYRIPALKMYLSLGFQPVYCHESHKERWENVFKTIQSQK